MSNPYFNLIRAVWRNGKPWRGKIFGYYIAFIVASIYPCELPYKPCWFMLRRRYGYNSAAFF